MLNYKSNILKSNAYNVVSQDCKSERISHAYLFLSEDDNYLNAFCEEIAKLLINLEPGTDTQKNNLRIEKRIHPDVKYFGYEKNIDAQTACDIVENANYSPFESDKKVFILCNVSAMNESSQNKILKTIEEPPKNTYFLMAGKTSSKLLPTILSRVKKIELDELSVSEICELLMQNGVEKNRAEIYASCSNGNGSFAEKLATDETFVDFFNKIVSCFFELNRSRDVLAFSSQFNSKSVDKNEFLNIFILIARDIAMILAKNEQMVLNKNIMPKLKVISSMLDLNAVSTLIKHCVNEKKNLEFNVNGTAVIDSVLFKLAEVKVKCRRL